MSFSLSFVVDKGETLQDTITFSGVRAPSDVLGNPETVTPAEEIAYTALAFVPHIIADGALGEVTENKFLITVSGHGNPDHKPVPGWANDCLTIQVVQQ